LLLVARISAICFSLLKVTMSLYEPIVVRNQDSGRSPSVAVDNVRR